MKLADWRNSKGMTQGELASRLGLIPLSISRYERGDRLPDPAVMIELYQLTGGVVTPNDFYDLPSLGERAAA